MGSLSGISDGPVRCRTVRPLLLGAIGLAILAPIVGCGSDSGLVSVTGHVTLDGQPLGDAGVMFVPVDKGPVASGTTDAAGRFRLTTTNAPGAQAGRYRVTITKRDVRGGSTLDAAFLQGQAIQWIVPAKYGNPDSSGLEAEVSPEQREFTFDTTSH